MILEQELGSWFEMFCGIFSKEVSSKEELL